MAVISELIDAGLALKEQGNHQAAIEHFRQLHVTYPDHARIMFELAGSWQVFNVPEQALPLYRELLAMPKSQGLPPKELPRLYTQMGASLRLMGQFAESLEIIEAGLRLFPNYRPLRAYHMFALYSAGLHQNAMVESLQLMLESLAPTKWDVYEDDIVAIVKQIHERVPAPDTSDLADWEFDEFWGEEGQDTPPEANGVEIDTPTDKLVDDGSTETNIITDNDGIDDTLASDDTPDTQAIDKGKIPITDDDSEDESFDIPVKIVKKDKKKTKSPKKDNHQFGKKPVKIDIHNIEDDEPAQPADTEPESDDDDSSPSSGKIDIPIDFD
jgi:hypothetical protein